MNTDRFRFRVWDAEKSRYVQFRSVYDIDPFAYVLGLPDGSNTIDNLFNALGHRNYTIEQCTGQKDRNGKLIYEGDIARVYWNNIREDYKILYSEADACFCTFCVSSSENAIEVRFSGIFLISDFLRGHPYNVEVEIIGNIHEVK